MQKCVSFIVRQWYYCKNAKSYSKEVTDEAPVRNMPGVMYKGYNINTVAALHVQGCPYIEIYNGMPGNAQTVQRIQRAVERNTVV
jgi:hypothetical protein